MPITIRQFLLGSDTRQAIEMPRGARPFYAGVSPDGKVCVWAEIDTEAPLEQRMFGVYADEEDIPMPRGNAALPRHVASFKLELRHRAAMIHVYEVPG